ncbi:MAG: DUF1499 domain-containing protein [Anaerolineales bacterium]|nr:DUF1499 domain-containing protein [Anaerolineales bacterium]
MQNLLITVAIALIVLVGGGFVALRMWAASAPRPNNLGLGADGQLAPCPGTPNCVTTQRGLESQRMTPLVYTTSLDDAQTHLREIIASLPRTQVLTDTRGYLHVEFRSPAMGYIDDVEFAFDDGAKQIHFRSASRLGVGDMGANRTRMTELSSLWAEGDGPSR